MYDIRKALYMCRINILKWFSNYKMYLLYLLIFMLIYGYDKPVAQFSILSKYNATPWIFPFLMSTNRFKYLIMFGIIFLFSDAPFIDEGQKYVILRSGKSNWLLGQVFYIMLSVFIYLFIINLISILLLLPNLFITNQWGKVFNTLAQQSNYAQPLSITYKIIQYYNPIEALLISFFLNWCIGTFLGLLIFNLNIYFNVYVGPIITIFVVLLDLLFNKSSLITLSSKYMYVSPITLGSLNIVDKTHFSSNPSLGNAIFYFIVLLTILVLFTLTKTIKKNLCEYSV